MNSAVPPSRLSSAYDDFLFAHVGDDFNGRPVSVLSILARLDLEPWEEAAKLARLSHSVAVDLLLRRISDSTNVLSHEAATAASAARLIALLAPVSRSPNVSRQLPANDGWDGMSFVVCLVGIILVLCVFGLQQLSASDGQAGRIDPRKSVPQQRLFEGYGEKQKTEGSARGPSPDERLSNAL